MNNGLGENLLIQIVMNKQKLIDEHSLELHFVIKNDSVLLLENFMSVCKITYEDFMLLKVTHKNANQLLLLYCARKNAKKIIANFIKMVNINKMFATTNEIKNISTLILFIKNLTLFSKIFAVNKIENINQTINGANLLHNACYKDNVPVLEFLLDQKADIDYKTDFNITPLYIAITHGALQNATFLITKGVNLDIIYQNGESILMIALRYEMEDIARQIIECGANLNIKDNKGDTALSIVFNKPKFDNIFKILVDRGVKIDNWDKFPLPKLLGKIGTENLSKLIDTSDEPELFTKYINTADSEGNTQLHLACKNHDEPLIKCLLKYGAERNAVNNWTKTPIHYVTGTHVKQLELTKLLIESGCIFRKANIKEHFKRDNFAFKKIGDYLGEYRNKLYVCYKNCRLILCANKYDPNSALFAEKFPVDVLRLILSFFVISVYKDIILVKKIK